MKKKGKLIKAVSLTLSASVLGSSCIETPDFVSKSTKYDSNLNIDNYDDFGEIAIPISTRLNKEDSEYVLFLKGLVTDIVANPSIAKEFSQNPKLLLQKYGYDRDVHLDDGMQKLILALGDTEINEALKNKDSSLFLKLCRKKGLMTNVIIKKHNNFPLKRTSSEGDLALFYSIPAVLIAVAAVVLVVYVVTHDSVEVSSITSIGAEDNLAVLADNNLVLNAWKLKNNDTTLFADKAIDDEINEVIEIIKQNDSQYFNNTSEDEFRNYLKINLWRYR